MAAFLRTKQWGIEIEQHAFVFPPIIQVFAKCIDDLGVGQECMTLFSAFGHRRIKVDFVQHVAVSVEHMPNFQCRHFFRTQSKAERTVEQSNISFRVCIFLREIDDALEFRFGQYLSLTFLHIMAQNV